MAGIKILKKKTGIIRVSETTNNIIYISIMSTMADDDV
jgi:hypothetical protein